MLTTSEKPKRYFSEAVVSKALKIPPVQLKRWSKQAILTPLVVESANGDSRAYEESEILAVAVSRRMRGRRLPLSMIVSVCNFLRSKSIDELEAEWADGRKYLLSVNKCDPLPALLSHAAIFDNPAIDLKAAADAGVDVTLIDVAEAYRELKSKILSFVRRERAAHARRVAESPVARGRRMRFLKEQAAKREAGTK